jgi:uncharacterized phage infection (PIP) family protein YhgE
MTLLPPSTETSSRGGATSTASSTSVKKLSKSLSSHSHLKNKIRSSTPPQSSSLPFSRSNSAPSAGPPKSSRRRVSHQPGHGETDDQEEMFRKVDFLFKKVREMDQQMNGIKSDFGHLKNVTKEVQNSSTYLSDVLRMDKHSILELREQLSGMKQKLERFSQQDQLQNRGRFSEPHSHPSSVPSVDVGLLSEQIFQRVHKEFTKVVDEVVRVCVNEQVDFMRKWSIKSTEEEDQEIRAQVASMKRRQNHFDEKLSELKGDSAPSSSP